MKAIEKINLLFDEASFVRTNAYMISENKNGETVYGDGVITGYGLVMGRPVYCACVDSSYLFGALGAVSSSKIEATVNSAVNAGAPFVLINESAGMRLEDGLNGLGGYGKIMNALSKASGIIPLIGVVNGNISGADSYMTAMCDFIFMTEKSKFSVTNSEVLAACNNLAPDSVAYSDAKANMENGNIDFVEADESSCIEKIKKLLFFLPDNSEDGVPAYICNDDLNRVSEEIEGSYKNGCDVKDIIKAVSDNNDFIEIKEGYTAMSIIGFSLFNGKTVGVVANNFKVAGGKICSLCCEKIANFVSFCDTFNIPVVTFTDVTGFSVKAESEKRGVAKKAAKLADAFSFASVPKVNIILGHAFGGASVLMNSKSLGADIVYAWRNSLVSAVAPETAAVLLYGNDIKSAADPVAKRTELAEQYRKEQADVINAAALGYVDDIIDPCETRSRIISALEILENKSARR